MKRVLHSNYYDNLYAEVEVSRVPEEVTDQEAANRCEGTIMILKQDQIALLSENKETIIRNEDLGMYSFEINIKRNQPPPIDPRTLSHQQILDLINNPDYMINEEDIRKVSWTISEAYQWLNKIEPLRQEFILSSASYRVEILT